MVGDEGQGSILNVLRKQGLAVQLSACAYVNEGGLHANRDWALFEVSIVLTKKGVEAWADAAAIVFEEMALLRDSTTTNQGELEQLYQEDGFFTRQRFDFAEATDRFETAEEIAANMLRYANEDVLNEGQLYESFDLKTIVETLVLLCSDGAHICLESRTVVEQCNQVEPWFGTQHTFTKVPIELTTQWAEADAACKTEGLFLRPLNKFVATQLALKPHPPAAVTTTAAYGSKTALTSSTVSPPSSAPAIDGESATPVAAAVAAEIDPTLPFPGYRPGKVPPTLYTLRQGELWHLQETSFRVPKAYYFFLLESPALCGARFWTEGCDRCMLVALLPDSATTALHLQSSLYIRADDRTVNSATATI
jgi:secreted Zn-dependent insulinase-like peptidase